MSSAKWSDPWYLGLKPRQRNLFDYLSECAENTCAGVYQFDPAVARLKTGPWTAAAFEETCQVAFQGHVKFYPGNWIWVVAYLEYNGRRGGKLSGDLAKGVFSILSKAPMQVVADFDARYGKEMALLGHPLGTLMGQTQDAPQTDHTPPYLSLPDLTKNPPTPLQPKVPEEMQPLYALIQTLPNWKSKPDDATWLAELVKDFPRLDYLAEVKLYRDRLKDGERKRFNHRMGLRNWMAKAIEFGRQKPEEAQRGTSGEALNQHYARGKA
ncbi:MAG: hypothetical protein WC683_04755 [bacterium]